MGPPGVGRGGRVGGYAHGQAGKREAEAGFQKKEAGDGWWLAGRGVQGQAHTLEGGGSSGLASQGTVGISGAGCCLQPPPHAEVERWEAEGPWAEGSLVPRVVPPVHSPTLDTDAGTCLASAATGAVQ